MALFDFLHIQRREEVSSGKEQGNLRENKSLDVEGNITYADGSRSSLTVPAFFHGVEIRANKMAQLVMEFQHKGRGGNYEVDMNPLLGRRINYLLQVEPNPYTNWTDMMRDIEINRLLMGNAYIFVQKNMREQVTAFWLCDSAVYDPITETYTIYYRKATLPVMRDKVAARNIIHLRGTFTYDGFTGISILQFAASRLNLSATQAAMVMETYSKGGMYKLYAQQSEKAQMGTGKIGDKQLKNAADQIAQDLPNKQVISIPSTVSVTNISQTLQAMENTANKSLTDRDLMMFLNVPKSYIGDDSNATYKSPEANVLQLLSDTIQPNMSQIEDEFNRKVLGYDDFGEYRFHLCEKALFRLDRKSQGEWNMNRLQTGVVSPNELRIEQELPHYAGGDDHYVSTNLAIAGSQKLNGAPVPAPTEKGGTE